MHKTLAIGFFLILAAAVHKTNANISLGACSLSCSKNEHQAQDMLELGAQGAPGKLAPVGPKGERGVKGDPGRRGAPGKSCECPDHEKLTAKVATLQEQFDELKGRVRYIGWTKASNNLFYKYFHEEVNYKTAKSECARHGARLAAAGLRTAALRGEIKILFPKVFSSDTWIGLDDLVSKGSYVWSDGVKSTTENTDWYTPQTGNRSHRCALMSTGQAYIYMCSGHSNYFCELSP